MTAKKQQHIRTIWLLSSTGDPTPSWIFRYELKKKSQIDGCMFVFFELIWCNKKWWNYQLETYTKELEEMQKVTKEEYLASLRRQSSGFSRGVSKYRGVARFLFFSFFFSFNFGNLRQIWAIIFSIFGYLKKTELINMKYDFFFF